MRDQRYYRLKEKGNLIGYPEPLTEALVSTFHDRDDCFSKVVRHTGKNKDRGIVEYWILPLSLAIELGIEPVSDFTTLEVGNYDNQWVLTSTNEVSVLHSVYETRKERKTPRKWYRGPMLAGLSNIEKPYLIPNNRPDERFIQKNATPEDDLVGRSKKDDPRLKAFIQVYLATGDKNYAFQVAFQDREGFGRNKANRVDKLLSREYVKEMMKNELKSKLEKVFNNLGIEDDPEEWVFAQRLEIIVRAMQSDKRLSIADRALDKMESMMGMKQKESESVKTTEILTLTEEDKQLLKQSKLQLKKETTEPAEEAKVVTDGNV